MDDALGFLKQKVTQGLSDVENWGSDAGNDVTNAIHSVFNSGSQAPQQQTATIAQPQQQTVSVNNQQQQMAKVSVTGQSPLATNVLNTPQTQQPSVPKPTPVVPLTKSPLLNIKNQSLASAIPTNQIKSTPQQPIKQSLEQAYRTVAPTQVINTVRAAAPATSALVAALTHNPVAQAHAQQAEANLLNNGKGLISMQQANASNPGAVVKGIVKGAAQVAPYAIPGGETLAPEASLATKAALSAGLYGAGNAGAVAVQGGNKKQILQSALQGALMGTTGELLHVGGKAAIENRTPLNQVGAIGKNLNEDAFTPKDQAFLNQKLAEGSDQPKTAEDLADLSPEEQMKRFEPDTPLNDAEVNTARNPIKPDIPTVAAGDYAQARINPQLASNPIEYAGGQWIKAMRNLQPDETANFWRAVEKPDGDYSPQLKEAISRWREVDDRIHGTSQTLGGNTNYLTDHALHPWNLPEGYGDHVVNGGAPDKFPGINNISRKYRTIEEGEKAGLQLGTDPIKEGIDYIGASSTLIKRRALFKSMTEADSGEDVKTRSLDIGGGHSIPLSDKGFNEAKGYARIPTPSKPVAAYRGAIRGSKQTLLSISQFHPLNISLLKAGPGLALRGHPILAAQGVFDTFRSEFGSGYSDALQQKALKDGTVDFGARVGAPMKFGSDFANEGTLRLGHSGLGERTIFEKAMPSMQYKALQGLKADLDKRGIPYDSPEARAAGTRVNEMLGFVNTQVRNLSSARQRAFSDVLLAPQFTRAKWATIRSALTERGLGGSYARAAVVGNTAMDFGLMLGLGYLGKQTSDDLNDTIIRSIFQPGIPTNQKDKNGNTIEYKLPASYTSEALGLLFTVNRGTDGHLHVAFEPSQLPNNLKNYGIARLNVPASTALKVATNTDYAGRPMFDPNAPLGTKAQQAATTAISGDLPIGLQGLAQTKIVKNALPVGAQQVLNATSPGTNPLLKSVASAFGATPETDKTVGKGLQSTQYYDALDAASKGLNSQEKDALNIITGGKKNPVTGQYEIDPTLYDTATKANLQLQNPKVLQALTALNQKLQSEGQQTDPFYSLPPGEQKAYLQYETINKNNTGQLSVWENQNSSWAQPFEQARSVYYNSLPPEDPSKPQEPITPPTENQDVTSLYSQYNNISDATDKSQFLAANPALSGYMSQYDAYTNNVLKAQGLAPLKPYPTTDPNTQSYTTAYMAASTADRTAMRTGNPQGYNDMQNYLAQVSEYDLDRQASIDQLSSAPSQEYLKDAYNLGQYDIAKTGTGSTVSYSLNPSLAYSQSGSGSSSSSSDPLVPLPPRPKRPKSMHAKKPRMAKFKHIKQRPTAKFKPTGGLHPTKVLNPTQVAHVRP